MFSCKFTFFPIYRKFFIFSAVIVICCCCCWCCCCFCCCCCYFFLLLIPLLLLLLLLLLPSEDEVAMLRRSPDRWQKNNRLAGSARQTRVSPLQLQPSLVFNRAAKEAQRELAAEKKIKEKWVTIKGASARPVVSRLFVESCLIENRFNVFLEGYCQI